MNSTESTIDSTCTIYNPPLFLYWGDNTESLKVTANAWLIAWALAYIMTGIFAPQISGNILEGAVLYATVGVALLLAALCFVDPQAPAKGQAYAKIALAILALISVYSAVASWSGLFVWNVPFQAKEVFQVSMGLMDFLGAVFMLIRALI